MSLDLSIDDGANSEQQSVGPIAETRLRSLFPTYAATEQIQTTDTVSTASAAQPYALSKAPADAVLEVTAVIDGVQRSFELPHQAIDVQTNSDGQPTAISFSDPDRQPDDETTVEVRYLAKSLLSRYLEVYEEDIQAIYNEIGLVRGGYYIETAHGPQLDLIGFQFGELGRRRGRNDVEYRALLRSLVKVFNGTGTRNDIKIAVATAIRGQTEDIEVAENYEQSGFYVIISQDPDTDVSRSISELVELSRPSGIELLAEPTVENPGGAMALDGGPVSVVGEGVGIGTDHISGTEIGGLGWETEPDDPERPTQSGIGDAYSSTTYGSGNYGTGTSGTDKYE